MVKVKLKKPVEVPANIQSFINGVLAVPLQNIAEPLKGFTWTYDKGDFTQWVGLFNRFDEFFEQLIKTRRDLHFKYDAGPHDPVFPEEACLQVLRVTAILLENCSSKHLYASYEHLSSLLAAPSRAVVAASLQTLMSFLKKTHHANIRWQGYKEMNTRLQALAQGWNGKELGLEMYTCVTQDDAHLAKALAVVTAFKFQFYREVAVADANSGAAAAPGHVVIKVQPSELAALYEQHGNTAHGITQYLIRQHAIPEQHRYSVFAAVSRALDMQSLVGRRHQTALRLMSLVVLAQSHSAVDELSATLGSEADLVMELVGIIAAATPGTAAASSPQQQVPEWLRALAVRSLAVMLQDRSRHNSVIAALNGGVGQGGSGLLSSLLQASINQYIASGKPGADLAAYSDPNKSPAHEHEELLQGTLQASSPSDFLEAMLNFVSSLILSSPGCQVLADAGVMQLLLSMLEDDCVDHLPVVASCVKLIESCLDISQQAAASYRDLHGLTAVVSRLAREVGVPAEDTSMQVDTSSAAATDSSSTPAATAADAAVAGSSSSSADQGNSVLYARKVLIKFLLRAIALSSYSSASGVSIRPQESDAALLYRCLRVLFERANAFGGSLFSLAATVMADAIHHDPLCYNALDKAALPDAFIKSVQAGVLPYGEAVMSISTGLVAMCLNTGGLTKVQQAKVMQAYVPIFTSKKYLKALTGDTPVMVGSGLEELFRFHPALRGEGAQALVDILRGLCILGGDTEEVTKAQDALAAWKKKQEEAVAAEAAAAAAATAEAEKKEAETSAVAAAAAMETDLPSVAVAATEGATAAAGGDDVEMQDTTTTAPAAADAATAMAVEPSPAPAAEEPAPAATADAAAAPAAAANATATATAKLGPPPYDFTALIAAASKGDAEHSYLPDAINYTTRMLESLIQNAETSKVFVEHGGVDLLLKIHQLPNLPYTFGFSASSHALLSLFRSLAPAHAQVVSNKTNEVLSKAVNQALERATTLPDNACVPALPAADRAAWIKAVASTAGLISISSAVARNTTVMLGIISLGADPVLPRLGRLERVLLVQAALADAWAAAREQAERKATSLLDKAAKEAAANKAAAAEASRAATPGPSRLSAAELVMDEAGEDAMQEDVGVGRDAAVDMVFGAPLEEAPAAGATGGGAAAAAATAGDAGAAASSSRSGSSSRKKTQEELATDILHHTNIMIRSLYIAMGKSIHTPARRSRDDSNTPNLGMRAAALGLATVLMGTLQHKIPDHVDDAALESAAKLGVEVALTLHKNNHADKAKKDAGNATESGNAGADAAATAGTAEATSPRAAPAEAPATVATPATLGYDPQAVTAGVVPSVVDSCKGQPLLTVSNHLIRLAEDVHMVLIDTRRRTCHVLVLNYFTALGGLKLFGQRLRDAFDVLFSLQKSATAAATTTDASAPTAATGSTSATADATDAVMGDAAAGDASVAAAAAGGPATPAGTAGNAAAATPHTLKRDPRVQAEKAIQAFLSVYEMLSSATLLLSAPQANQLLSQALPPSAGAAASAQVRDPAELVRVIQSQLVEAIAPLWAGNQLAACPPAIMSSVVAVLGACAEGIPPAAALLLRGSRTGGRQNAAAWQPDPNVVQSLVDMGFPQARAEYALRRLGVNSAEAATEWLLTHPEEVPAQPAAGGAAVAGAGTAATAAAAGAASAATTEPAPRSDEDQLGEALTASLQAINLSADQLQPPRQAAVVGAASGAAATAIGSAPMETSAARAVSDATAATAASTGTDAATAAAAGISKPAVPSAATSVIGVESLVSGAMSSVQQTPTDTTIFSMGDLLSTLAVKDKEEGREPGSLVQALMQHLRGKDLTLADRVANQAALPELLAASRLLLVVLSKDVVSREAAVSKGLLTLLLDMLEVWMDSYKKSTASFPIGSTDTAAAKTALQVPVWVEAALLLLELFVGMTPKPTPAPATNTSTTPAAAATATATPAAAGTGSADVEMTPAAAASGDKATGTDKAGPAAATPVDVLQAASQEAQRSWKPCGMLDDGAQSRAVQLCVSMLKTLHSHAHLWAPTAEQLLEVSQARASPTPATTTQATLSLLARLCKKYGNAQAVMSAGCHKLLLCLPSACWAPTFATLEPSIQAVLKCCMEDPVTLSGWMESEIRNYFAQRANRPRMPGDPYHRTADGQRNVSLSMFITGMARTMGRDPSVFLETVPKVVVLESVPGADKMVRLRKPTDPEPGAVKDASGSTSAGGPSRQVSAVAGAASAAAAAAVTGGSGGSSKPGSSSAAPGAAVAGKSSGKKHVPGSLVEITDLLIEIVMQNHEEVAVKSAAATAGGKEATAGNATMDVDTAAATATDTAATAGKDQAASDQPQTALQAALKSPKATLEHLCTYPAQFAWQAIALRLLTDSVLLYGSSVGLLLKRDLELWAKQHPPSPEGITTAEKTHHAAVTPAVKADKPGHKTPAVTPAAGKAADKEHAMTATAAKDSKDTSKDKDTTKDQSKDKASSSHKAGALLKQLMHVHLVSEDLPLVTQNRAERTAHLLQAICVRSVEGRKRIVNEMVLTLLGDEALKDPNLTSVHGLDQAAYTQDDLAVALAPVVGASPATGASFARAPGKPAPAKARALVNLIRWMLFGMDSGVSRYDAYGRQNQAKLSAEMVKTMRDTGMVKALTASMRQVMLEHPRAARTLAVILTSLETLTRPVPLKAKQKQNATTAAQPEDGNVAAGAGGGAGAAGGGAGPSAAAGNAPGNAAAEGGVAGPSAAAATPGPAAGAAATPLPPGTQVPATPADATGLRAPAGAAALNAVGRGQTTGGGRLPRGRVAQLLQDIDAAMSDGDDDNDDEDDMLMGDEDELDEDEEAGEGDSDDEGDDEDMEGEDDDDIVIEGADGMAIEVPGVGIVQVMEGDPGEHDSDDEDDEGMDSDSDDHVGEDDDDDEHPDARGDIGTDDDDEVLDTEDEEEDDDDEGDVHGDHMGEVHDPHDVMLDMDHGEGDAVMAGGGVGDAVHHEGDDHDDDDGDDGDDDGGGDDEEDEEDDQDDDDAPDTVGDYEQVHVPFGMIDDDDVGNGDGDYDDEEDDGGMAEYEDEEFEMMNDPNMFMPREMRRMTHAISNRVRDALAMAGGGGTPSRGLSDTDVGTGFGAMADIPAGSLQAVLPTLCSLLGDAAIGGVLGAARQAGGGGAGNRGLRVIARDPNGRERVLDQPLLGLPVSGLARSGGLANSAPTSVPHRLLVRPPPPAGSAAAAPQQGTGLDNDFMMLNPVSMGGGGGGMGGPGALLRINPDNLRGTIAALEQQVMNVTNRAINPALAMDMLERLANLPSQLGIGQGGRAGGLLGVTGPAGAAANNNTLVDETGMDIRSLENAMLRVLRGSDTASDAAAAPAAPAAGTAASRERETMEAMLRAFNPAAIFEALGQPSGAAAAAAATGAAAAAQPAAPNAAATPLATPAPVTQAAAAAPSASGGNASIAVTPAPAAPAPSTRPETTVVPPAGETARALQEALAAALAPTPAAATAPQAVAATPTATAAPVTTVAVAPSPADPLASALQQALAAAMGPAPGTSAGPAPPTATTAAPTPALQQPAQDADAAMDTEGPTGMDIEQEQHPTEQQQSMSITQQAGSESASMMMTDATGPEAAAAAAPPPAGQAAQQQQAEAAGSTLSSAWRRAAQAAGIDLAFLEALPEELRAEVLAMHGAQLSESEDEEEQDEAPPPQQQQEPQQAAADNVPAAAPGNAAAAGGGQAPPVAAAAPPAAAPAAPAAPAEADTLGLDPEFLAALPPDIRAELIEQQRTEQRRQAASRRRAQEAAEREAARAAQAAAAAQQAAAAAAAGAATAAAGAPAEPGNAEAPAGNAAEGAAAAAAGASGGGSGAGDGGDDFATILATFPPDVREDVLLTADDATIATLPPAVREEARVLRARYRANTFQQEDMMMLPPEPAVRTAVRGGAGDARAMPFPGQARTATAVRGAAQPAGGVSATDTATAARRAAQEEDDRILATLPPLVDQQDIAAMVGLLYLSGLQRVPLQRTLLNLCAHAASRKALLRILMGAVRHLTETQGVAGASAGSSAEGEGAGSAMDVMDTATPSAATPGTLQPVALPGLNIKVDSATAPSMLRRVIESVTYLVRHSSMVARMLLMLDVPDLQSTSSHGPSLPSRSSQETAMHADEIGGQVPSALSVLLRTLKNPMCSRSSTTLEFALQLVESQLKATQSYIKELNSRIQVERKTQEDKRKKQQEEEEKKAKKEASKESTATAPPAAAAAATPMATPQATPQQAAGTAVSALTPIAPTAAAQVTASAATPTTPLPAGQRATTQTAATAFGSPFVTGSTGATAATATPAPATASEIQVEAGNTSAAAAASAAMETDDASKGGTAGSAPAAGSAASPEMSEAETKLRDSLQAARKVLQDIPSDLLRYPVELLSQAGLTQIAYTRTSHVLLSVADVAPSQLAVVLQELQLRVSDVGRSLEQVLVKLADAGEAHQAPHAQGGGSTGSTSQASTVQSATSAWLQTETSNLSSIANQGAGVLRLLHLLQSYCKQSQKALQQQTGNADGNADTPQQQQQAGVAVSSPAAVSQPSVSPHVPAAAAEVTTTTSAAEQAQQASEEQLSLASPSSIAALEAAVACVSAALEPLWHALSAVIAHIESTIPRNPSADNAAAGGNATTANKTLPPGAAQVMPLVESFFVVCNLQGVAPVHDSAHGQPQPSVSTGAPPQRLPSVEMTSPQPLATRTTSVGVQGPSPSGSKQGGSQRPADVAFTRFAERHRSLLNAYLRRSPNLLETSLTPLLHVPKLIEFDNKKSYFRTKVRQYDEQHGGGRPYGSLRITVRREHVFEDSFHQLRVRAPEEMRLKLNITFQGEEGIDAGGVTREWYQVIAREVFNPNLALFVQVPEGGSTFQPNPNSVVQSDRGINHLDYFKFVGRIVGKALHDGQLIDAYFTRSFYKHLLGQALTYEDIEAVDPGYYKNLLWMLQNDITDILELTFTAESDFFGRKEIVELVPGGKDLKVTEANKRQYVDLIARHRMTTSIKSQISAFTQGFWELVPKHLINIFNDHELELMISGLPDIDLDDLRANTEYHGLSPTSPAIRWFWEVVYELNKEDRALLIQFVTGTSKVPLEGFKALQGVGGPQKFQIHKAYGAAENRLPTAHTCFNQLDLPEYDSKEKLRERLLLAMHEGATGFGFV